MSRPAWSLFNYQLIEPDEQLDLFACQEVRVHLVTRQLELGGTIDRTLCGTLLPAQPRWSQVDRSIFQDQRLCPLCRAILNRRSVARHRSGRSCVSSCKGQLEARFTYTIDFYLPVVLRRIFRMLSRLSVVTCCLSLAALCAAGSASALQLPLPPPGEDIVGQVQVIKAKYEDTFADLGTTYDLGYSEMVAANPGVDAWLPGAGTEIVLPTRFILPPGPREGIVINLAEYRLYYFPKGQNVVYTFPLGIGREGWGSPIAHTSIIAKTPNPTWTPPASIKAEHAANGDPLPNVVPAGPDNPLGPFKFTLGTPGYLIHGSNAKFGIGTRTSHGCFRMFNNNVLEMAGMVPVGTSVRIINDAYKFGRSGGKVYLEAHTPLNDDGTPSVVDKHTAVINALLKREDLANQLRVNWDQVRDVVAAEDGLPTEIGVPGPAPIASSAPIDLQQ